MEKMSVFNGFGADVREEVLVLLRKHETVNVYKFMLGRLGVHQAFESGYKVNGGELVATFNSSDFTEEEKNTAYANRQNWLAKEARREMALEMRYS